MKNSLAEAREFFLSYTKIKQFIGGDVQSVTDVEHNVQGNGAVSRFDAAHVGAADIDFFSQCFLRETAGLAVVGDIQPQAFVFLMLLLFHGLTPIV